MDRGIEGGAGSVSDAVAAVGAIQPIGSILDVICRITGLGFAAVARVTDDRWLACQVRDDIGFGLEPGGELDIKTTICRAVRADNRAVVIDDVADDPDWRDHPIPKMYGFRAYISVPIVLADGTFFGTLCAIGPEPVRVKTPQTISMFKLFAELIAFHIDGLMRTEAAEASLSDARRDSELREQFIAVLGHDLRNPLASVEAGAKMLARAELDEKSSNILALMQGSVRRMSGLIDNVMDFARGRLGDGIAIERDASAPLTPVLEQVVEEIRAAHPERTITTDLHTEGAVSCDRLRIAQLFSNLLANAVMHGGDEAIRVEAGVAGDMFELSVENAGGIDPETAEQLFLPFARGKAHSSRHGLGLGLYIASEIARAHDGAIRLESPEGRTRFVFRMPAG